MNRHAIRPPIERTDYGKLVSTFHCCKCHTALTLKFKTPGHAKVSEFVEKKMRQRHWTPGRDRAHDLCAACSTWKTEAAKPVDVLMHPAGAGSGAPRGAMRVRPETLDKLLEAYNDDVFCEAFEERLAAEFNASPEEAAPAAETEPTTQPQEIKMLDKTTNKTPVDAPDAEKKLVRLSRLDERKIGTMLEGNIVPADDGYFEYINGMSDKLIVEKFIAEGGNPQANWTHVRSLRRDLIGMLRPPTKQTPPNKDLGRIEALEKRIDELERLYLELSARK